MSAPDATGRFGDFGGRFVPEALMPACLELESAFVDAWSDPTFVEEYHLVLREFAGRPTPVTPLTRLSERLGIRLYAKREDLAHTGSHKINNVIGQTLLTKRMGKRRVIAETGAGQHGVATATAATFKVPMWVHVWTMCAIAVPLCTLLTIFGDRLTVFVHNIEDRGHHWCQTHHCPRFEMHRKESEVKPSP